MHDSQSLHEAAKCCNPAIAQALLEKKAEVNTKDRAGRTPLHAAVMLGHVEVVNLLLEKRANVNAKTSFHDITPLHFAARHDHIKVVRLLLKKEANVNAQNEYGRTPLHEAVQHDHIEVVRLLLEKGANVNAQDSAGRTPLHYVARLQWGRPNQVWDRPKLAQALLEKVANVNTKDLAGRTPLDYAAEKCHIGVADCLLKEGADLYLISDSARGVLERSRLRLSAVSRKHFSIYYTAKSIRSLMYGVLTTGLLSALYCFRNNINWLANIAGKYLLSLPILTGSISIMFVAMNAYKASGFKAEYLSVSEMIKKGCGRAVGINPNGP